MVFCIEMISLPGCLRDALPMLGQVTAGFKDPQWIGFASLFSSLFVISMLFGFLRRWFKPRAVIPPTGTQPLPVQAQPEKIADNSALIANLGSESAEVRGKAAQQLGERHATEALGPLLRLLQDPDKNVRFWTAWALGTIKDNAASHALIECLSDFDEGVRYRAAEALGEIQSLKAVEPLQGCLNDRSERVRKIAKWALDQITGAAGNEEQQPPADVEPTVEKPAIREEPARVEAPPKPVRQATPEPVRPIVPPVEEIPRVIPDPPPRVAPEPPISLGEAADAPDIAQGPPIHAPIRFPQPDVSRKPVQMQSQAAEIRPPARERSVPLPKNIEEILRVTKERSTDRDINARSISFLRHVIKQERPDELLLSEPLEPVSAGEQHDTDIVIKLRPYDAEGQFAAGVAFSQAGDWETAIDCYKRALRFKSDLAKAYCNLGVAYCHINSPKEGIFYLRQAIRFRPNWPKPYINLGIACSQQGDWQAAIKALNKGTRNPSEKLNAYYNLGVAYSQIGQWEKAAQAFVLVVNATPEDVPALCNLGISYTYLGCWGEAAEAFKQSTMINPGDSRLQCCLGLLYCHLGRYDEGIKAFETAIKIKPDDVEAYCILGLAKGQLGLWEGAVVALNQAVRLRDDFPEIQYYLGVIYEEQGRWQEAAWAFKQFSQLGTASGPQDSQPVFEGQKVRWDEMKVALTQTLKYNPKMIEAYHLLGRYYEQRNDWQEASAAFMEAAKLKIREGQPQFILGELDERSFGQQRALEEIRRVILNKPEFFKPRFSLSVSLNDYDRYRKTYVALKRMIQINPQNADTFYKFGRTCTYLGHYNTAIQAYREATRLAPDNIMAHYYLALSYLAIGDRISAAEEYAAIKDLNEQLAGILFY